jgi:GH15 family glucan-1,4-alpha-glucosidase
MNNIVPQALDAIRRNVTKDYMVKAAEDSPGLWHKDYLHVWPRDSIFVALEMMKHDRAFAEKIVESVMSLPCDNGLFYQRYEQNSHPDPHGWCNNDDSRQLDQEALRFVILSRLPKIDFDMKVLEKSYSELLRLVREKKPSTDVWEQKRGYFFYTTASIIWGLLSAEKIVPDLRKGHADILKDIVKSLDSFYDEGLRSFVKSPSERIIDLEVILGINVLFESGLNIFERKNDLLRVVSTLQALEDELCYVVCGIKIPIRYKGDFWNGEFVSDGSDCKPWPMGCAFISQTYCHVAERALKIGDMELHEKSLRNAKRWLDYMRSTPNIESFPEQIDFDGSIPKQVPKPLTWCAAEVIKAERIYKEAKDKSPRKIFYSRPLYYN